jgi:hypothetical protein
MTSLESSITNYYDWVLERALYLYDAIDPIRSRVDAELVELGVLLPWDQVSDEDKYAGAKWDRCRIRREHCTELDSACRDFDAFQQEHSEVLSNACRDEGVEPLSTSYLPYGDCPELLEEVDS